MTQSKDMPEIIYLDNETATTAGTREEKGTTKYIRADLISPNRAVLDALIALKDAVAQSGKLNGKEYDSLGIQVNNAIAAATQADTFKIVQNLEQAIKDLDEDGEIDRHNEEAIEEAARAYFSLQVEHLKRQITKI